jgi:hypothetical protein
MRQPLAGFFIFPAAEPQAQPRTITRRALDMRKPYRPSYFDHDHVPGKKHLIVIVCVL